MYLITARQRSCDKVMFSQVSHILFRRRGVPLWQLHLPLAPPQDIRHRITPALLPSPSPSHSSPPPTLLPSDIRHEDPFPAPADAPSGGNHWDLFKLFTWRPPSLLVLTSNDQNMYGMLSRSAIFPWRDVENKGRDMTVTFNDVCTGFYISSDVVESNMLMENGECSHDSVSSFSVSLRSYHCLPSGGGQVSGENNLDTLTVSPFKDHY